MGGTVEERRRRFQRLLSHTRVEEPRENKEKSFKNQHFLKTSSTTPLSGYCAKY